MIQVKVYKVQSKKKSTDRIERLRKFFQPDDGALCDQWGILGLYIHAIQYIYRHGRPQITCLMKACWQYVMNGGYSLIQYIGRHGHPQITCLMKACWQCVRSSDTVSD